VAPFAASDTLRLLHIRVSGLDTAGEGTRRFSSKRSTRRGIIPSRHSVVYLSRDKVLDPSVEAFAKWIFGEDGIKSLKVLAIGDFSYHGRFRADNSLLCRQDRTDQTAAFRRVEETDIPLCSLIYSNLDFLMACPVEPIFEY
jgi:hypothetical protein